MTYPSNRRRGYLGCAEIEQVTRQTEELEPTPNRDHAVTSSGHHLLAGNGCTATDPGLQHIRRSSSLIIWLEVVEQILNIKDG